MICIESKLHIIIKTHHDTKKMSLFSGVANEFSMGLDGKIIVIDGGFATQLSVHVGDRVDGDPLWSARFNATNPSAVVQTHLDFLRCGADAILTNTYQASVEGYMQYLELSEAESIALMKTSVKLAHRARSIYLQETGRDNSAIGICDTYS